MPKTWAVGFSIQMFYKWYFPFGTVNTLVSEASFYNIQQGFIKKRW